MTVGEGGTGQSVQSHEAGLIASGVAVEGAELVAQVLTKAELHENANP